MFRILAYEIDNPVLVDINYCVDDILTKVVLVLGCV